MRIIYSLLLLQLITVYQTSVQSLSSPGTKKFYGGAGVGRLTFDEKAAMEDGWKCKYDMVLVERIQGKPEQESGLFIPDEDLPKYHLSKGMCSNFSFYPAYKHGLFFLTHIYKTKNSIINR